MCAAPEVDQCSDPDYLSLILRGLDVFNDQQKRFSEPSKSNKRAERQARVLESLAHLLVSHPGHVVAVAAAKSESGTGFDILVAENETDRPSGTTTTSTADHLNEIFSRLREIRALWDAKEPGSARMPKIVPFDATSDFERKVVELEKLVLQRAWPKLARRIGKNSRLMYFLDTARDVCGKPASERKDLANDRERELLQSLQKLSFLPDLRLRVQALTCLASTLDEDTLRDDDTKSIRAILSSAQIWRADLEKDDDGKAWNNYTRSRQASKQSGTVLASHDINIVRWLTDISSIRDHFYCVAKITTSRGLSPMLALVEDIVSVDLRASSNVPRSFEINRERLLPVLYPQPRFETVIDDASIQEFLKSLQVLYEGTWSDSEQTQLRIELNGTVHYECLLLTKLHGRAAIGSIGLSKPSCLFCNRYLAAYCNISGKHRQIWTLTYHARASPNWMFPTLEDPISETIRKDFCMEILWKIDPSWIRYVRGLSVDYNDW